MAQATARHSSSMTAYLFSVFVRNRDPACTVFHSSLLSADFWRTNPNPSVLASVYRRVSLVVSKYATVGTDVSAFLACVKASSCGSSHQNLFRVLRRGLSGANTSVMCGTGCKLIDESKKGV